ncbi:phosphatidate cytidylyltransferase [Caldimonas sp. KR1-144]|uniref:phosphatidate cytidylyltransferase n=1 Tax=Caldimonas sp. KR1-144 TaxID=3400911 RepID=UPI003C1180CE
MLRQRILTAVLLLALLLPAVFASSPQPFALLALVAIGAAGWEWARLNGWPGARAVALGVVVALGAVLIWWVARGPAADVTWLWWLAVLWWVAGGSLVLARGVARWPDWPVAMRCLLGIVLLWAAGLALATARARGVNFLLSVFALVWVADVAAYFGGRAFGRRKLAPAISPGKSWEGVWSGLVAVIVLALAWVAFDRAYAATIDGASLFSELRARGGLVVLVLAVVFLAALSVVGDLFESLVKRSAGAKDSSGLLPGHGGVLDRIDALLPVFPVALALISL